MTADLEKQVIARVAEQAGVEPDVVTLDSAFADLNIDSLAAISMVGELEDEFHVSIPNERVMTIRTVGDALLALEEAIAAGGGT